MNLLQLFDADLGVNGRGVELGVAEQLLDKPDVRPVFQHVRRACVPQQVARRHPPRHLPDPRGHHAGHHVGIERAAVGKLIEGTPTGEPSLAVFRGAVFQGEAKAGKSW